MNTNSWYPSSVHRPLPRGRPGRNSVSSKAPELAKSQSQVSFRIVDEVPIRLQSLWTNPEPYVPRAHRPLPKGMPLQPDNSVHRRSIMDKELNWGWLFFNYSQGTSLHGIKYIGESSRFMVRRFIWAIFVAASLGVLIYYAYDRISYYRQYPKNVNVEVNYLSKVKFPAVTFCNQNTFRITAVADRGWYDMVKAVFSEPTVLHDNRPCTGAEFQCLEDKSCVPLSAVCDAFPDCSDNSDELECDPCPMLILEANDTLESKLPQLFNRLFEIQHNTWSDTRPVYITNKEPYIVLFSQNNQWILADNYKDSSKYAYIDDDANSAQGVGSGTMWKVNISGSWLDAPQFIVTCKIAFEELLIEKEVIIDSELTLSDLYINASHQEEDFIQDCEWKGAPCEEGSITRRLTDMGVCYTYNSSDMFVEQAGPGYGLSLMANIEQYEYTKSTDSGIGVKLLMHEADDVPMMKERGIAVSPGLYSFISVETTEVENLKPPWGTCGGKDLEYFDQYSVARCVSECETNYVSDEQRCGCKDLQMPSKNGLPEECDVDRYINCTKPALDELRAMGNYCSCATPCKQLAYVPTTSFSIVLGGDGNSQDTKTSALQKALFRAREVTYRVVKDKYKGTMKMFHSINHHMTQMIKFTQVLMEDVTSEYSSIVGYALQVKADCVWVRNMLFRAQTEIEVKLLSPLTDFKQILWGNAVELYKEYRQMIEETLNNIDENTIFDEENALYFSRQNDTLWQMYRSLHSVLDQIANVLHGEMFSAVSSLPNMNEFRLQKDTFDPISSNIGDNCLWCVDDVGTPVLEILRSRVMDYVGESLQYSLSLVKTRTHNAYETYLADLWVTNVTLDVFKANVSFFLWRLNDGIYRLNSATNYINMALSEPREVLHFIDDLTDYTWSLQCQTKLPKLLSEYSGNQRVIQELLASQITFFEKHLTALLLRQQQYINNTITLEDVSSHIKANEILTFATDNKLKIDSTLNSRILLLEEIQVQVEQIYYVMMVQVENSYMSSESAYWKTLGITSPLVRKPITTTINGIAIPLPDFGMVHEDKASEIWKDKLDILRNAKENLMKQTNELSTSLSSAKSYFDSYVVGNQLNSNFYSMNFLQVELFYKELTERKVSQQVAYDSQNLMSEIGGLMGLLLGASVLSLVEVLDLFVYNLFRKCFQALDRNKVRTVSTVWETSEENIKHQALGHI